MGLAEIIIQEREVVRRALQVQMGEAEAAAYLPNQMEALEMNGAVGVQAVAVVVLIMAHRLVTEDYTAAQAEEMKKMATVDQAHKASSSSPILRHLPPRTPSLP